MSQRNEPPANPGRFKEQMQLGLEDLKQAIAQGEAKAERGDPTLKQARAAKRRTNRGTLADAFAADRGDVGAAGYSLPVLPRDDGGDRP